MTQKILSIIIIASILFSCRGQTQEDGFNLIYISLDTTRYDHIDTGNGALASTPFIKNFSKNSLVFEKAFITIPETLPSHLTIFTSQYPHHLGVIQNHTRYTKNYEMIQEVLKNHGYYTYGIISLISLIEPGFWKGFDEFNHQLCAAEAEHLFLTADKITFHAEKKLAAIKKKRFFMFIHYSDPHYPYSPPSAEGTFDFYLDGKRISRHNPYKGTIVPKFNLNPGKHNLKFEMGKCASDFEYIGIIEITPDAKIIDKSKNIHFSKTTFSGSYLLKGENGFMTVECEKEISMHLQFLPKLKIDKARKMYKKEVEFQDKYVGKFLQTLQKNHLLDNTIVVIFGDHGEGLGERDNYVGHVEYLNQQFIRAPLIVYIPGEQARIIKSPVTLAGLSTTILEYLNFKPKKFQHSFFHTIKNQKTLENKIHSFTYNPNTIFSKISILDWPYQGILYWNKQSQFREFYNLQEHISYCQNDQKNIAHLNPEEKKIYSRFIQESLELKKKIDSMDLGKRKFDRKRVKQLRKLGYFN